MIRSLAFVLVLVAVISESAAAAQPDSATVIPDSLANTSVFHSAQARVEIHKPLTWHFTDLRVVANNASSVKMSDEDFLDAVRRKNKKPLITAAKYEESHAGPN